MGRKTAIAALGGVLVLAAALATVVASARWQYMIVDIPDDQFMSAMNAFGDDRWEMTSARRASASTPGSGEFGYEIIFRRRRIPLLSAHASTDAALASIAGRAKTNANAATVAARSVIVDNTDHTFHLSTCKFIVMQAGAMTVTDALAAGYKPNDDCKPMTP